MTDEADDPANGCPIFSTLRASFRRDRYSAIVDDERTYAVIGAAMQVHRELGSGFLEVTYQRALALELATRGIPHQREVPVPVAYRGTHIGTFRADFECFDGLLLELKAASSISEQAVWQLAHYLTASGRPTGLLLNFGAASLQFRRVLPRRSRLA